MSFKLENISKRYGNEAVLSHFSMAMEPGEIKLIVGESGSGKTTLLRLINHLIDIDDGTIEISGTPLVQAGKYASPSQIKAYQYKVGLVFQDFQLFPNLTIIDNILLSPKLNKLADKTTLERQAISLLDRLGLHGKIMAKPSSLSGGQKQRAAIARAMMLKPELLCFDEPTSALDQQSASNIGQLITELADDSMMILIITHDQGLVKQFEGKADIIQSSSFIVD